MLEQQVNGAKLPTLVARGNVLYVCHLSAFKDHGTSHNMVLVLYHIKLYVLGEETHQFQYLLIRMYRLAVVVRHQHILQQRPELPQSFFVRFRHAVKIATMIHRLLGLTHTQGTHLQRITLIDGRTHKPSCQLCSSTEQSIQILVTGNSTIDIWYGFVIHLNGLHIVAIIAQHLLHDGHHLHLSNLRQHDKTTIRKSLMRIYALVVFVIVGREYSHQVLRGQMTLLVFIIRRHTVIYQQRAVKEPVAMIIHKVTLQQECSVLGTFHKRIPRIFPIY